MTIKYVVVCKALVGDKSKSELGWVSGPLKTRGAANQLVWFLEGEPNKCPGPHEVKEIDLP